MQLSGGDVIHFGAGKRIEVIHTPGRAAGRVSDLWRGNVFTGDTLLIDGCGRTDLQSVSFALLYGRVVGKLFALPDTMRMWPSHDCKGRSVSTFGSEKHHKARTANRSKDKIGVLMAALNFPKPELIDIAMHADQNLRLPHEI